MRDRLIELLSSLTCWGNGCDERGCGECGKVCLPTDDIVILADYLLKNGVVVPSVKVNQTVYVIDKADVQRPIKEKIVLEIQCGYSGDLFVLQDTPFRLRRAYNFGEIGKTVFLTREKAEAKLQEGKG